VGYRPPQVPAAVDDEGSGLTVAELEHRPRPFGSLRDWWEEESRRPTGGSPAARIHQLYRRRNVLRMLITRDLKKRYETSYLGYAWTLLEPGLLLGVYYLVWGRIGRFGLQDFLLFMATALMPWLWFRSTVRGSSSAISGNSRLVNSINLPREIYPLALALTEGIEYLLTLPLVLVIALVYGRAPTHYAVFLPIAMVLELVLVTGAALLMSSLTTLFKDIDRLMSSLLRVLFYLTPVIYPTGRLHGWVHKLFVLDPLVGIFELHRKVFFPETQITVFMMTVSVVGSFLVFIVGWSVFIRLERAMLKEL
jgi:ABC-2 type transport system permease protein